MSDDGLTRVPPSDSSASSPGAEHPKVGAVQPPWRKRWIIALPIIALLVAFGIVAGRSDSKGPTTASTSAPTTIGPEAESDSSSGLLDDLDTESLRPLTDLAEGDVVIASYVHPGMEFQRPPRLFEHGDHSTEFSFDWQTADDAAYGAVRLWNGASGPLDPSSSDDPNHPPFEIAGTTWGWNDFESAREARIGPFLVWAYLDGLEEMEAERFIEGLRAVSIEQFPPVSIEFDVSDQYWATNDLNLAGAEVVASGPLFELAALRVRDQICTKLKEKAKPPTMVFGINCYEPAQLDDSGIFGYSSYQDDTGTTRYLVIGLIDSTDATAARIISPTGESVVVPTGPVNQDINGRFFLADVLVDDTLQIATEQITVEDASP